MEYCFRRNMSSVVMSFISCSLELCVILSLLVNVQCLEGPSEYCELDVFQPSCGDDEVIMMKSAYYGKMAVGRCIKQDYGHIGCKANVLPIMDGFCSGRRTCSVKAVHEILVQAKSKVCPSDFAAYLSPEYACLKVEHGKASDCRSNGHLAVSSHTGYISIPSDSSIGGSGCPWRISLSRKVNISMISFPSKPSIDSSGSSSACYEIGSIKEKGKIKTIHKCLNDAREKQLYLSKGGPVELVFNNRETLEVAGYFILHYQATGCGDPTIPDNAEVQHANDRVVVKCKTSDQKWELLCSDGRWTGEVGKCVQGGTGWSFLGLFDHEHPFGTAIVVGIGATLGVLVGGILLYIIIAIFKRCQKSDYVMTYEYTDPSFAHIPTDYHADKSNLLLQDDKLFEQNSNTWGSQRHGNSNTLSRGGGTDHSRVPLPPLPNDNNTLSYEKPLYNRNGNV